MQAFTRFVVRHRFVIGLMLLVYALDQATKYAVSHLLALGESWPAEGLFRITYIFNTGSAFGLFRGQNTPLIFASFVGIVILAVVYRTHPNPTWVLHTSLGLQLAGAVGNLTDRLTVGRVIDFVDVGRWPIFNVADSAIVMGVLLLAWVILTTGAKRKPDDDVVAPTAQEPSASHEHHQP